MTAALTITMTNAGRERFTAAQVGEGIELQISSVGLTDAKFVIAPTLDALPGEFRRIQTISGEAVGNNIVHMVIRDTDAVGYSVRGIGLFLADGTLFAVYGQPDPIFEKSTLTTLHLALDIAFTTPDIDALTFGDTNFLIPPATEVTRGVVELATIEEAEAGDATRVTTGWVVAAMLKGLQNAVSDVLASIMSRRIDGAGLVKGGGDLTASRTLTVDAANAEQLRFGAAPDYVATAAGLKQAGFIFLVEQQTDGVNRYRRYSDGLIEMSGVSGLPGTESTFTLNFPWPFLNECEGLWATVINTAQTNDGQSTVQEVALSIDHATLYAQNHKTPTVDAAGGFRWFARGR